MTVYPTWTLSASVTWPAPIEPVWQLLPTTECPPGYQRRDLGLSDRLFIGAVVNLPKAQRPWGSVTWLADVFGTIRPTIYAIGERARQGMAALPSLSWRAVQGGRPKRLHAPAESQASAEKPATVVVTPNRLARTILTLLMPGGVSGRTIDDCLRVALDQGRSLGFVSELLHMAGQRAGKILDGVDHSPLGPVVQARDDLFRPILVYLCAGQTMCPIHSCTAQAR